MADQAIDPKALRHALGRFATGVAVVTTRVDDSDGGITINSFTSVSLEPPLVLWCIAKTSQSLDKFQRASHFTVNVLSAHQVETSNRFAFREGSDFPSSVPFTRGQNGAARLSEACANFECKVTQRLEGGDHLIVLGQVINFEEHDFPALLYHNGAYAVSESHPELIRQDASTEPAQEAPDGALLRPGLWKVGAKLEEQFETELKQLGLTSNQWRVIQALEDRMAYSEEEIANHSMVSGSPLSDSLQTLLRKNLVHVTPTAEDQAAFQLTQLGRELCNKVNNSTKDFESQFLAGLSTTDAETLKRLLGELSARI